MDTNNHNAADDAGGNDARRRERGEHLRPTSVGKFEYVHKDSWTEGRRQVNAEVKLSCLA